MFQTIRIFSETIINKKHQPIQIAICSLPTPLQDLLSRSPFPLLLKPAPLNCLSGSLTIRFNETYIAENVNKKMKKLLNCAHPHIFSYVVTTGFGELFRI
jgi:hypothetical protein